MSDLTIPTIPTQNQARLPRARLAPAVEATRPLRRFSLGAWGLRLAALSYLAVVVLIPLLVISVEGLSNGLEVFIQSVTRPAALHAVWLTIWTAAVMTVINLVMGTLTAYILVVYEFRGKRWLSALIDLPFAIPTLISGVMLVLLYGPQTALGAFFQKQLGLQIVFAPPGIILALLFVSYPFVVRTVQPALLHLDPDEVEAASTLGASGWYTFRRVIFPAIRSSLITGGLLSFARALGEFGALAIVAGNLPMRTQVASVYIYGQIESGNPQAAAGVSVMLLILAFGLTFGLDVWQTWQQQRLSSEKVTL
jgi:sulfate transport system permease protein